MEELNALIEKVVLVKDSKKYLFCAKAYEISIENDISMLEIGKYCNKNGIKIAKCQLGCF